MLRIIHDDGVAPATGPVLELDELCRIAAREMLALALEAERRAYLEAHAGVLDGAGHRLVVGNGYARERPVVSGTRRAGKGTSWRPRLECADPLFGFQIQASLSNTS